MKDKSEAFFCKNEGVKKCNNKLSKYFHPKDTTLEYRFEFLYKVFDLSDNKIATEVGIDRTTMNRYRRGIFIPTTDMKMLIAKAISKLANYSVDSAVIWGEDLIFSKWKEGATSPSSPNKNEQETKL